MNHEPNPKHLKPPGISAWCYTFNFLICIVCMFALDLNSIYLKKNRKNIKSVKFGPRNQRSISPTMLCRSPEIAVPLRSSSTSHMRAKFSRSPVILVSANTNLSILSFFGMKNSMKIAQEPASHWLITGSQLLGPCENVNAGYLEAVHWTAWRIDEHFTGYGYLRIWQHNSHGKCLAYEWLSYWHIALVIHGPKMLGGDIWGMVIPQKRNLVISNTIKARFFTTVWGSPIRGLSKLSSRKTSRSP